MDDQQRRVALLLKKKIYLLIKKKKRLLNSEKSARRYWVHSINEKRDRLVVYANLVKELREDEDSRRQDRKAKYKIHLHKLLGLPMKVPTRIYDHILLWF